MIGKSELANSSRGLFVRIVWLRSVVGERKAKPAAERRRKPATFVAILQMQARDERAACEAQRNNPRVGHGAQRFFTNWNFCGHDGVNSATALRTSAGSNVFISWNGLNLNWETGWN
jgi:hypothetical protein